MYHYGNAPLSLQSLSDASEIKMKHARSSFDYQLQKRTEAEDALKQYVSHSQNYTSLGREIGGSTILEMCVHVISALALLVQ